MKTTTVAVSNEEFEDHGHITVDLTIAYETGQNDAALRVLNDAYAEARRRIE